MTTFLLFALAVALAVIGLLLQLGEELGGAFLGGIAAMTRKMGPGVTMDPPKRGHGHWLFYIAAVASLVGGIWRIFT